MKSSGKPSRRKKAVGSIIGAVFLVLIILSGFTFYQLYLNISDHYNGTLQSMGDSDWSRNREEIVIKNVDMTSAGNLNVTVENDGAFQSHLIWFGIFNKSATPETQAYYPLDLSIDPAETKNLVSSFVVTQGKKYAVQLVTELGNAIGFKFYPASEVKCWLTLTTAPPTAYKGNNVTVVLTVTHNDSEVDAIQSLTVSLSATPSGLVQLMDNSSLSVEGLAKGGSAFFWWVYNTANTGTVSFNATYLQAPAGTYTLSTVQIVSPPQQGGQGNVTITGINCTAPQNPSQWNLLGSTQNVSGSVSDLASNDTNYAIFNSYYSGTSNINYFVDNNSSDVDSNGDLGTHSNFTALRYGPDSIYDTLTEAGYSAFEYGQAFKSSNVRVSTTSGTPVDDSEAVLNVNLTKASSVFMIYNAGNKDGSTEDYRGKGCAISVDGVDSAFSWQSPYSPNYANSVTVAYAANLTAGSHVIKGRFFANLAGNTVGIDMRQIVAFWFPSVVTAFVRSTTPSTTTSNSPVDDPQATLTFSLSSNSIAFILYNAGNKHNSIEPSTGKGVTINVDGGDIATKEWQSPLTSNYADSATIPYVASLAAGSHTVKGRFFSNSAGSTTTIDERQLIVFCFPASLITYGFVQSTTAVATSSGTPVDDTQAFLNPALTQNSDSLVMYVGGNSPSVTEHYRGKGVQLNIDGTDNSNSSSWQSPYDSNYADSETTLLYGQLTAGSHTIKGRFFANYAGNNVTISHRQLLILAFPIQQINYKLDLEAQWTNVDYSQQNEQLCIYAGNMGSNALGVDYWNGSNWINLFTNPTANSWNNASVALTSSVFTIRFEAGIYTNDTTQGTWNIDAVLLHLWTTEDQYTAEVELTGSSNQQSWTQLVWLVDSSWDTGQVNVTIQAYNYTLGSYPSSGDGYISYNSSATPYTDELGSQIITSGATQFRNSTSPCYWKVKIKGVKSTSTQFQMKVNWIELQDSYAYTGDTVPYKAWQWYTIQATGASGNPVPFTYASLYANGTTVTFQNATDGTPVSNPAWLRLDANGTFQLQTKSTTSSGETFVLSVAVGTVIQQKTIIQAAQQ
jgi:hypothetical protein